MSDLLDRLDAYPDLSPEDRTVLEREVAADGDPELAAALADAQALAALLAAAAPSPPASPLAVARHLVSTRLGHASDADAFQDALRQHPELRAEAERVSARLDALAAEVEDPVAQFERLTGRSLAPARAAAPDRAAVAPPRAARVSRMRLARGLAVAATVCFVAYGGLFLASGLATPEAIRVADLDAAFDYREPTLRGDSTDDLGAPLAAALGRLADAQRTTLGLFPRYDAADLAAASAEIGAIADAAEAGSGVQQEALMSLARIQLHAERYADAAATLQRIDALGGYDAPEARRLLDYALAQAGS